jgi:uncharacterized protein YaiL (DUF2058 family)
MTDSLRDQLMKLGFKKPEPPARPAAAPPQRHAAKPAAAQANQRNGAAKPVAAPGNARPGQQQQRPQQDRRRSQVSVGKPGSDPKPQRSQEEIDLARAYAMRDRLEREERERIKRETEAKARERREKRVQLRTLLEGKSQNDAEADLLRHFPQGGKIKRVHVNAEQLPRLNAGELGVVQMEGRYYLVDRDTALAVRAAVPEALVLLPEPGDAGDDDWTQAAAAESAAS